MNKELEEKLREEAYMDGWFFEDYLEAVTSSAMLEHAVRRAVELRDRPVPYMNVDEILAQVLREVKGE